MIRVFCLSAVIAVTFLLPVRADWPSSCPGGVCPARTVTPGPTLYMTAAPAIRVPLSDTPADLCRPIEKETLFPVVRTANYDQLVAAPVRRIVVFPVRLIRWFRNPG
jgi:hypothetical protein